MKLQYRPLMFALAFIATSALTSFAGEEAFFRLGLYANRLGYSKAPYAIGIGVLLTALFCAEATVSLLSILLRASKKRDLAVVGDRAFEVKLSRSVVLIRIALILIIPLQLMYIALMWREVLLGKSVDGARLALQAVVPFLPRTFWYGSFLLGLGALSWMLGSSRRSTRLLLAIEAALLFMYGSKFLLVMPVAASAVTGIAYRSVTITKRQVTAAVLIALAIAALATLYTNYRSQGKSLVAALFVVDVVATIMPEQRDGAYLMYQATVDAFDVKERYSTTLITGLAVAIVGNRFARLLGAPDIQTVLEEKRAAKDYLAYEFEGYPRDGLVSDAYLSGGWGGVAISSAIFAVLLSVSAAGVSILREDPLLAYTAGISWFNCLWAFNSSLLIALPFATSLLYFAVFLLVARVLLFSVPSQQMGPHLKVGKE